MVTPNLEMTACHHLLLISFMNYQLFMYYDEIVLCAQNINTILNSTGNTTGSMHVITHRKEKKRKTLQYDIL